MRWLDELPKQLDACAVFFPSELFARGLRACRMRQKGLMVRWRANTHTKSFVRVRVRLQLVLYFCDAKMDFDKYP